jgi:hypothetical protein
LAKRRSSTKTVSKSDVIRKILKRHSEATVAEVRTVLKRRGLKASDALINKIKYGRRETDTNKKPVARSAGNAQVSKADAIRNAWSELGHHARPRDVISVLAQRGVSVSSAQVSTLRKSPRRHGRGSAEATSVSLDHLLAAKTLVDRLGSIDVARTALANLARLVEV